MNKLFSKIAAASVGLAMAVGVGVAVGHKADAAKADDTSTTTYTISTYPAGTQYADNESHVLDSVLTVVTNQAHFTSEIRMYNDGGGGGKVTDNWVKLVSLKKISALTINANCNTSKQTTTFQLKGSNNGGADYTVIDSKATKSGTSYGDITFAFAADTSYTTLLLKNTGSYQGRIKTLTVTYINEAVTVDSVAVSGSTSVTSGYLGYKNIKYSADVVYSAGQGDESVTWTTNSTKNTINEDGVLHITANEETVVTATSVEDTSISGSITVNISGLVSRTFSSESVEVTTDEFGTNNIISEAAGTPAVLQSGNLRFSVDKADASTNPGFIASDPVSIRVYSGAAITVSTIDGNNMYFVSLKSVNAGNKMSAAVVSLNTGVVDIDENGDAIIDLTANPVSSFTMTVSAQVRIDLATAYYYTQTDAEAVQEFIDNFMHMDDYTEELGYCSDSEHHYYIDAKAAFNGLSETRRSLFMTDSTYEAAKDRLVAWAAANHDYIDGNNTIVADESYAPVFGEGSTGANIIIIIIAATFAVTTFGAILLIRKKKHSK